MIKAIRTSLNGEKFYGLPETDFCGRDNNLQTAVIDSGRTFQQHIGFGGAFTESAAYTLSRLSKETRAQAVSAYFSEDGLRYNIGRTHINSCDFSLTNYHYINNNDKNLDSFDIGREDKFVVPLILDAQKAAGVKLGILASPWSPPPHFKDTLEMNYGGKLKPEFMKLWAEYICRYILEMRKRGVNIEYLTIQNEPLSSQVWDSCVYTAEEERDFIKVFMLPALQQNSLDTKLIIWDHNRDLMIEYASVIYADSKCRENIWGTGIHWYVKENHENLSVHKTLFPEKHIMFTEGCVEYKPYAAAEERAEKGDWRNAETYGRNIINDFNNYCEGFIDWNLVLDEKGGPNHAKNYCEAPLMADTANDKLIYNPSYYYIGHFSKYIKPGAKRIYSAHNCGKDISLTAYINPDGKVIAVIMNTGWIKRIGLSADGKSLNISLPDHSITTFIIG